MRCLLVILLCGWQVREGLCFWDEYTTTKQPTLDTDTERTSFFRWCWTHWDTFWIIFPTGYSRDYTTLRNRALASVAGISIAFLPITSAALLNRRTLLTAANPLEPFKSRQGEMRIWALGRAGLHDTPYRYRVWRFRRLLPRSVNPEHQVGPRGRFSTRHDVVIVHSRDQMYLVTPPLTRYLYATRFYLTAKLDTISTDNIFIAGISTTDVGNVIENYKIIFYDLTRELIVNCEKYLPKYWGKHICMLQRQPPLTGLLNGATLVVNDKVFAVGAFEIRYNEDRVLVFTDIRYYIDWINVMANISNGGYYDYAYQQWGVSLGFIYDGSGVSNFFPTQYIQNDFWPLGK